MSSLIAKISNAIHPQTWDESPFEWHPYSSILRPRDAKGEKIEHPMRRKRHDGSWEYRAMTQSELDEQESLEAW